MFRILLLLSFLCPLIPSKGRAQSLISGIVYAETGEVLYANVSVQHTNNGTSTDENGQFHLSISNEGAYTLLVSALGYKPWQRSLSLTKKESLDLGSIYLESSALGLEEVVVTGTMKETFVTASPIKVEVITAKYLEKTISPTNIVEGIKMVNGVQEVVACGVCFTNSISINGLPGPYTAILMDGAPIYGNLASVYGLNGIPTMIIDRFEVIKGPSSTLYGSEAVAGVINIITKSPASQPLLAIDIMGTSHLESFGSLAISPKMNKWKGYIGLNYAYINDFDDQNEDGFGDVANLDRISLFTKWMMERKSGKPFTIAAKYYYEDRRNGVEAFLKNRAYRSLRGSDLVYGESIYTKRAELFGTYALATKADLKIDYSLSHHVQDSYYGSDNYDAKQSILFANFLWEHRADKHDFLFGATARWQLYDDNTVATATFDPIDKRLINQPDEQFIPGIFVQDEWRMSSRLSLLNGLRLDHYHEHGPILSPRINLKYKLSEWTTLRTNMGTGFRIVNLFTEDHAFVTGQRQVEILESLRPERSLNGSLNLHHLFLLGKGQGTIDIDAFYTYFTNKIVPNYDTPGKIFYANAEGYAQSRGIGLGIQYEFAIPLSFNIGFNLLKVTETAPDEQGNKQAKAIEYAPNWSQVATANYQWKKKGITMAYTLNLTGPMTLPLVFDLDENGQPMSQPRPTQSKPFAFQNLQLTKTIKKWNGNIYVGIQNLFNYRQSYSPLVGFNDPATAPGFSPYFDTAYAYSPIHGREFYLGIRWQTAK